MPPGRPQPPSECRRQTARQSTAQDCSLQQGIACGRFHGREANMAHAAGFENMNEAALDQLVAVAHGLLADARSQLAAVRIDRCTRLIVARRSSASRRRFPWPCASASRDRSPHCRGARSPASQRSPRSSNRQTMPRSLPILRNNLRIENHHRRVSSS